MYTRRLLVTGILALVPFSVHAVVPPAPGVTITTEQVEKLKKMAAQDYSTANLAPWIQARKARKLAARSGEGPQLSAPTTGTVRLPMLLGQYSTGPAPIFTVTQLDNQIFESNPTGTMVSYYNEVSYGDIALIGDTYGWFVAPDTQAYYSVSNGLDPENRGREFVEDIVAASDATVNYALYDANGDCFVDTVMVVHTDGGAETGDADNIWSHRWVLSPTYTTNDPCPAGGFMKVSDYIIQPAENGDGTLNDIVEIGVFCHEFGHALGLPDLYDYDDPPNDSEGVGEWCLMASGSYGGDGAHADRPSHMSAWCKKELGWVIPTTVTVNLYGETLSQAETNRDVYLIRKDGAASGLEYFLVENRQQTGFDQYLHNSGILIWHIDEAQSNNNDEDHYMVDLEQADGDRDLNLGVNRGDAADPWPGTTGKTTFGPSSNPNSDYYTIGLTNVFVDNISASGANMTADLIVSPGVAGGLRLADANGDGLVQMLDAQVALRTIIGAVSGSNCAYPSILVNNDSKANVKDVLLISQYVNGQQAVGSLPGPAGTPVTLSIVSGNNQDGYTGQELATPLQIDLASRAPSTCYKTMDLPVRYQFTSDTTNGAFLRNNVTLFSGTLVPTDIPANDGLTETVTLTLGTDVGAAVVQAAIPVLRPDGIFLANGTVSFNAFNQTCGNGTVNGPYEQCDGGNQVSGDGCSSICQTEFCGDGLTDFDGPDNIGGNSDDEECDDGNMANGDGCSSTCLVEGFQDPTGDATDETWFTPPAPTYYPDIEFYNVQVVGSTVQGYITMDGNIDSSQHYFHLHMDTDQNALTGTTNPRVDQFPWIPSNVTPHGIAWEFEMRLRAAPFSNVVVNTGNFIQCNPTVNIVGNTIDFSFPLTCIGGDDGIFNYAILGSGFDTGANSFYPADVAPNSGFNTSF